MTTSDFTITITVHQTPKKAFDAINDVRGWWSENTAGNTHQLNSEFEHHFEDIHRCKMKIIELVPEKKVVWQVLSNHFKPGTFDDSSHESKTTAKHSKDKDEWKGTKIIFEISKKDDKTEIRFTHLGLVPELECYKFCAKGWKEGVGKSLLSLITTGKGQPDPKETP